MPHWNGIIVTKSTRLYHFRAALLESHGYCVEAGATYELAASGIWYDASTPSGPDLEIELEMTNYRFPQ